ncbi:hypothetical protein E8L99_02735 [Phreatobacter aquaticus]|uniref:Uncharacterized protein n=1 Tax=Phreatobacter aquaticus TaxID=2570229 RepID=A0A4D7QKC6_9HYPH|nr:hypothetical protein [Phreatobacter aquaticus]QCK84772.1 hypothetical protein E8L99_02735 [Phreatobacter aquaticus]
MLGFTRAITRRRYALGLAGRIGLFVAVTAGFPFLVMFLIQISGARNVSGASGALAVVLGIYLKPLIYLLFALSMMRIAARRAASVGRTSFIGLGITVVMLGDIGFATVFGSHWGVAFSLGVLSLQAPWLLLAAIIAVVTLGILRDQAGGQPAGRWFAFAYLVWIAIFCGLVGYAVVTLVPPVLLITKPGGMAATMAWLTKIWMPIIAMLPRPIFLTLTFAGASLWLIVADRAAPPSAGSPHTDRPGPSPQPGPFQPAAAIGSGR